MGHPSSKLFISITAYCAISFTCPILAAQSDVLDINQIGNADISTLLEDTKTFNTIGMGIALSIAECHGKDICQPTVDEGELGQLIETLDQRIEGAKSEGKFIEKQIKLIQEGTEAKIESNPLFIAEAGDHSLAQVISYGPSLLNLGNNNPGWVGY